MSRKMENTEIYNYKEFISKLGFVPKDNENGIFFKKFPMFNYVIEVNFEVKRFDFGSKIKVESGTTQNFSQEENWVVLECVNRLLEKGYKPEDITLEKIYPTGHGTSGRLDILVQKEKKAYLMIECKTWGNEYQKALKKMQKDGGQLFTYFQQDRDTQYLMLYASEFNKSEIHFENEIIKIEEHYREAGNVKDFYDRWNKLSKSNGIFDKWVNAYEFQNKALTINDLKIIKQEDSSFIFHRFLEILRQNVVSDKPNAFNKIFTLFLCKIVDEDRAKNEQLHFQYLEGEDDNISFQKRLTDLYKRGMHELLEKDVVDMGDDDFKKKFGAVDEKYKSEFLKILTEIRLKKNNEFAFKEVFDDQSFSENAKVVKEVVELLQEYQIRYNKKHQYLGDFFELLLTTGLKQESGQYFTPVPVAKYIIKSLPIKEIIQEKILKGNPNDLIPFTIDYAAGSGHFLIESMEYIQKIIDSIDENTLNPQSIKKISAWKTNQFEWAFDYVYGIEKDYRLVKTAKVGCYLHGDGLAKVIHGDGLGTFDKTTEYRVKLKEIDNDFPQDNKQFDLVISNPPYSVSAFKGNLVEENAKSSFELFDRLTDQSSEIECLFIERTKQLLKDDGLAGIILPSSILSNTGIYTKTREIIFKYFEIIGITELGSGTFMATGTNTVILFLRRRNNYEWENIKFSIEKFFQNHLDITVNGIENIFSKYVKYVWDGIQFEDYIALCNNKINENIENHEIYKEYEKKLKVKNKEELHKKIIEKEQEKLLYFILAYNQKVILTKSGQKNEEKKFLGYEFSNRRGSEGIHPIQRGKSIDACTKMYDQENQEDETKASSYVYKAFLRNKTQKIHTSLEKNIFEINLIDMMTFDRVDFEKSISLALKKTQKIESKWKTMKLGDLVEYTQGLIYGKGDESNIETSKKILTSSNIDLDVNKLILDKLRYLNEQVNVDPVLSLKKDDIFICTSSGSRAHLGKNILIRKNYTDYYFGGFCAVLRSKGIIDQNIVHNFLQTNEFRSYIEADGGQNINNLKKDYLLDFKVPILPKDIQQKIVNEIMVLEQKEEENKEKVGKLKNEIKNLLQSNSKSSLKKLLKEINPNKNEAIKLDNNAEVSFLTMADVSNFGVITNIQKRKFEDVKKGFTFFQEEDVLFAKITPCMENGKGALVPKMKNNIGFGSTEFFVLRANKEKLLPKILFYFTQSHEFRQSAEKEMTGASGHRRVPKSFIENYEISLFSLSEQQKIVVEIEKIEKQIETLKSNLQEFSKQKAEILKKYL
jgi:type I restriction enzyme M protein